MTRCEIEALSEWARISTQGIFLVGDEREDDYFYGAGEDGVEVEGCDAIFLLVNVLSQHLF